MGVNHLLHSGGIPSAPLVPKPALESWRIGFADISVRLYFVQQIPSVYNGWI